MSDDSVALDFEAMMSALGEARQALVPLQMAELASVGVSVFRWLPVNLSGSLAALADAATAAAHVAHELRNAYDHAELVAMEATAADLQQMGLEMDS